MSIENTNKVYYRNLTRNGIFRKIWNYENSDATAIYIDNVVFDDLEQSKGFIKLHDTKSNTSNFLKETNQILS